MIALSKIDYSVETLEIVVAEAYENVVVVYLLVCLTCWIISSRTMHMCHLVPVAAFMHLFCVAGCIVNQFMRKPYRTFCDCVSDDKTN